MIPDRPFSWKYRIQSEKRGWFILSEARNLPTAKTLGRVRPSSMSQRWDTFSTNSRSRCTLVTSLKSTATLWCLFLVRKPDQSTSSSWVSAILLSISSRKGSAKWAGSIFILLQVQGIEDDICCCRRLQFCFWQRSWLATLGQALVTLLVSRRMVTSPPRRSPSFYLREPSFSLALRACSKHSYSTKTYTFGPGDQFCLTTNILTGPYLPNTPFKYSSLAILGSLRIDAQTTGIRWSRISYSGLLDTTFHRFRWSAKNILKLGFWVLCSRMLMLWQSAQAFDASYTRRNFTNAKFLQIQMFQIQPQPCTSQRITGQLISARPEMNSSRTRMGQLIWEGRRACSYRLLRWSCGRCAMANCSSLSFQKVPARIAKRILWSSSQRCRYSLFQLRCLRSRDRLRSQLCLPYFLFLWRLGQGIENTCHGNANGNASYGDVQLSCFYLVWILAYVYQFIRETMAEGFMDGNQLKLKAFLVVQNGSTLNIICEETYGCHQGQQQKYQRRGRGKIIQLQADPAMQYFFLQYSITPNFNPSLTPYPTIPLFPHFKLPNLYLKFIPPEYLFMFLQKVKSSHGSLTELPARQPKLFEIFKGSQMAAKQIVQDDDKNLEKFVELLAAELVDQEEIRNLAWNGVPPCIRAKVWKYLMQYITGNRSQSTIVLERKRKDYSKLVQTYLPVIDIEKIDCQANMKTARIIQVDVKRTLPQAKIIRHQKVQQVLTRSLYIWHVRHPASGYVQGISDLVVPFFLTFLNEYIPLNFKEIGEAVNLDKVQEETWEHIQADIYWCTSKMLDAVTSNYVRGFGGIKESFKVFEDLLKQIDPELHKYLLHRKIDLFCLTFRQISTFLLRMFAPKVGIRLFDTYISCGDSYPTFTLYLLIAILVKFSNQLQKLNFDDIMRFMQKPPTKDWTEGDLQTIISEAYVYRTHFVYRNKEEA